MSRPRWFASPNGGMIEFHPVAVPGSGRGALHAGMALHVAFEPPPELLLLELVLALPPLPPSPPVAPDPVVTVVVDPSEPQAATAMSMHIEPRKEMFLYVMRP